MQPDQLSSADLDRVLDAYARRDAAQDHLAAQQEHLDLVLELMRARYQLGPHDALAQGGRIVRGAHDQADEAPPTA